MPAAAIAEAFQNAKTLLAEGSSVVVTNIAGTHSFLTATLAYGGIVLAGTALAGPTRAAGRVSELIAPALRDPMWASFGTLLLLILLIWWGPTPGLRDPLGIVLISGLLIGGLIAIRHQTIREFPGVPPSEQPTKPA